MTLYKIMESNQMWFHGRGILSDLKFCHSVINNEILNSFLEAKIIITLLKTNQDSFFKKISCTVRLQNFAIQA